jgi:hypothetical protein
MSEMIARTVASGLRAMPYGSGINTFSLAEECSNKGRGYGSSSQTGVSNSGRSSSRAMPYGSDYQHLLAGRGTFKQRKRLWFKFANWC